MNCYMDKFCKVGFITDLFYNRAHNQQFVLAVTFYWSHMDSTQGFVFVKMAVMGEIFTSSFRSYSS